MAIGDDAKASFNVGRLHPNWSKPVVKLPVIGLVVLCLIALPFVLLGFEQSYSDFSTDYVVEDAAKSLKENRLDDAAVALERLAISHKLNSKQAALLNDVYFARASKRALQLDYVNALTDLDRITPDYRNIDQVANRRSEIDGLYKRQQIQIAKAANISVIETKKSRHSKSRNPAVGADIAASPISPSPSVNFLPVITASTTDAKQQYDAKLPPVSIAKKQPLTALSVEPSAPAVGDTKNGLDSAKPLSFSQSLGSEFGNGRSDSEPHSGLSSGFQISVSPNSKRRPRTSLAPSVQAVSETGAIARSQSAVAPSQNSIAVPGSASPLIADKSVGSAKKPAKGSDGEMVRYNELLAAYFSQEHKHSAASSEPPSFKEWLDQNKPTF